MEVKRHDKIEVARDRIANLSKDNKWYSQAQDNEVLEIARELNKVSGGIFSSIPIICKAADCPYASACELQKMDIAPYGEKCPIEIAALEDLFARYCSDMGVNPSDPEQQVDAIMIKEIVDIDIAMLRCDKKFAMSADYIIQNVVGITEDHQPIMQESITPIADYKERLRNQKFKTLNLMNSTRKDKRGSMVTVNANPIERAGALVAAMKEVNTTDIDTEERERYMKRMEEIKERTGNSGKLNTEEVIDVIEVEVSKD